MRPSIRALALVLALVVPPAAARAVVRVFANPSSPTFQGVLTYQLSTQTFNVYVEKDALASGTNPCTPTGTGDKLCAYDVAILIDGGGYITNFVPSTAMSHWPTAFPNPPGNVVRKLGAAFVSASSPPLNAQPMLIGTLTVNGTPPGGTRVLVTGKQVVDAALQSRTVPSVTLATLPEPARIAQLASGVLALALLYRWRRARAT